MQIVRHHYQRINVGKIERAASVAAGILLFSRGLRTKGWLGTSTALMGVAFMRRGLTGFCYTYQALGINTAEFPIQNGVRINEAVTINRPREEVYRFWRDVSNIGLLMQHVESVGPSISGNRSRWVLKTDSEKQMEWESELINERPGELIAWRSIANAEVCNAGSVHFADAAGQRGTEVTVQLWYRPHTFLADPTEWIRQDLKRVKAQMEAGVLPETEGQPAGAQKAEEAPQIDTVANASEESFPASDAPAYIH